MESLQGEKPVYGKCLALHPLSSHRWSRSLLPGYTEHVHAGALLTATWGLGEKKGGLGWQRKQLLYSEQRS